MIDYQKLATMIFRIIGCFFFVVAIIAFIFCFTAPFFGWHSGMIVVFLMFYPLPLAIFGAVFWFSSSKLAKFVCKGLENSNK